MKIIIATLLFTLALNATAAEVKLSRVESANPKLVELPARISGRVNEVAEGRSGYLQQWPGVYFEAAFAGPKVFFKVGESHFVLHISVDNNNPEILTAPKPGLYVVEGLTKKSHKIRIDVVTESQSGANNFGGFFLPSGAKALTVAKPARQIEIIGDSHTVGYGNISTKRDCTNDDVWATTETLQAYGPVVARHYQADYQINAISGRGIVRNYGGFLADTMPQAYPYVLFDKAAAYHNEQWHPKIIVISLGTNDFSTALNANEKWKSRDELHADYEKTYIKFVQDLRNRNPDATFILWTADGEKGELMGEVKNVVSQLNALGDKKVTLIPVANLEMTGCHWHPSNKDDQTIAEKIINYIDSNPTIW